MRRIWNELLASLWFVPSLIVLGAIVLAVGLVELDARLDNGTFAEWPRLFGAGAEGSRGMLSAIASSMITVAGVVFSITIVALSLASNQYSPRVLRNFMSDRTNQTVLGVFVGIFAYCLVVLRTIRGGDEGVFIPSLAVLTGVVLALVGIAFLIFFIHHIAASIQASHILANVAAETLRSIENMFPEPLGEGEASTEGESPEESLESFIDSSRWRNVLALKTGYIQHVDADRLLRTARERRVVIRILHGIGAFAIEGTPLVAVVAVESEPERDLAKELAPPIQETFTVNRQRTVDQDPAFGIRQIVDVALKALSPGVNDTTTALMCVDYLTAILVRLSTKRMPSPYRFEEGRLRVIAEGPTFASLVAEAIDDVRQNATGNAAVLDALLRCLKIVGEQARDAARRKVITDQVVYVAELAEKSVTASRERDLLGKQAQRIIDSQLHASSNAPNS